MTTPFTFDDGLEMLWKFSKSMPHGFVGLDFVEAYPEQEDDTPWRRWVLVLHFLRSPLDDDAAVRGLLEDIDIRHIHITPVDGSRIDARRINLEFLDVNAHLELRLRLALYRDQRHRYNVFDLRIVGRNFIFPMLSASQFTTASLELSVDQRGTTPARRTQLPAVEIDYRARDYESVRKLMLNQLSTTAPQWRADVPADLGSVLVETLAYAADRLSYFQDAVGTEGYLDTARRRISVRRHARLMDYKIGEGCNSRTWVYFRVDTDVLLPKRQLLLTRLEGYPHTGVPSSAASLKRAVAGRAQIFETLYETPLYYAHNTLHIFTFESTDYTLAKGAVEVVLRGHPPYLHPGGLLLLEQIAGVDAHGALDHRLRHVVRITEVKYLPPKPLRKALSDGQQRTDRAPSINPQEFTVVSWAHEDALPFTLPVTRGSMTPLAVVRGNLVAADQGYSGEHQILPVVPEDAPYQPTLNEFDLTWWVPYEHMVMSTLPARYTLEATSRLAVPYIHLTEVNPAGEHLEHIWEARHDLLDSTAYDRHFVVESENDRGVRLRFGDGVNGWRPDPGNYFVARFRTGTGLEGNVGSDTIAHLVIPIAAGNAGCPVDGEADDRGFEAPTMQNILEVRNPVPAVGGLAPESPARIRLAAPMAWQTQKRCITEEDYAAMAEKHPEVTRAVARRKWTGSWYTLFLYVDREEGRPVDPGFQAWVRRFMEPYLLLSDHITIRSPHFVSLDIVLRVEVLEGFFANQVRGRLMEVLGPGMDAEGNKGLFHPDRLTFGQTINLNQVVGKALQVDGVKSVARQVFRRWGEEGLETLRDGKIEMDLLEIPRITNDPDNPAAGNLTIKIDEHARRLTDDDAEPAAD